MFQCFLGFHPNMISASEKLPPISESPCQHSGNRPCGTAPCSSFRPAPLSESCICGTAPCSSFPPAHHSETWPCGTAPCSSFHPVSLSESWLCRTASCISFPSAHLSEIIFAQEMKSSSGTYFLQLPSHCISTPCSAGRTNCGASSRLWQDI